MAFLASVRGGDATGSGGFRISLGAGGVPTVPSANTAGLNSLLGTPGWAGIGSRWGILGGGAGGRLGGGGATRGGLVCWDRCWGNGSLGWGVSMTTGKDAVISVSVSSSSCVVGTKDGGVGAGEADIGGVGVDGDSGGVDVSICHGFRCHRLSDRHRWGQ